MPALLIIGCYMIKRRMTRPGIRSQEVELRQFQKSVVGKDLLDHVIDLTGKTS